VCGTAFLAEARETRGRESGTEVECDLLAPLKALTDGLVIVVVEWRDEHFGLRVRQGLAIELKNEELLTNEDAVDLGKVLLDPLSSLNRNL